jgi:Beta-propeller domains of methanol dehydrogenase type
MGKTKQIKVTNLKLDLTNYRTVHQPDEEHATNALISIHPNYFWGLMESLLDDGYSPTENLVVLSVNGSLIVKEGNRRTASLKLIHGITKNVEVPDHIQDRINKLSSQWKTQNELIPCVVYPEKDAALVDKLVARTHAKGDTAGRDKWNSVATARYARDQLKKSEPGLDLLEAYLARGRNLNPQQAERWSGEYPLTVLNEALQKLAPILKAKGAADLAASYPTKHKKLFDGVLFDIGTGTLGFKEIRDVSQSWLGSYSLTVPNPGANPGGGSGASGGAGSTRGSGSGGGGGGSSGGKGTGGSTRSHPLNDPKSVRKILRSFRARGTGREKIAALLVEIRTLKLETHPHAFCFLLRSLFELSAKAYCVDHKKSGGPNPKKNDGSDKSLADLLRDIVNHLTKNGTDKVKTKMLHGPMTELGKKDGLLSVTSMNQLVHHPSFSVSPPDICILFANVFPLLEEMNG